MQALEKRKTVRAYSDREIPMQTLSNLLWAASGVNRADGRMTAPTARNLQEITLYVLLPSGIFRYDAPANRLVRISAENITGQVTGKAPLTVVYVADLKKQPKRELCAVDCGYISQNIYLYCFIQVLLLRLICCNNNTKLSLHIRETTNISSNLFRISTDYSCDLDILSL